MHKDPNEPDPPRSWAAEVIADASGTWCGNLLRFATWDEARLYSIDLMGRWFAVRERRVVPSQDPVRHRWDTETCKAVPITNEPSEQEATR